MNTRITAYVRRGAPAPSYDIASRTVRDTFCGEELAITALCFLDSGGSLTPRERRVFHQAYTEAFYDLCRVDLFWSIYRDYQRIDANPTMLEAPR